MDLTEQADRTLAGILHALDLSAGGCEGGTCAHHVGELEMPRLTWAIRTEARDQRVGFVEVAKGDGSSTAMTHDSAMR